MRIDTLRDVLIHELKDLYSAEMLGEKEAAQLLQQTLDEEAETERKLTELAVSQINQRASNGDDDE